MVTSVPQPSDKTPAPQTLQQRFGFQDADLKSPRHDAIMLWLDENMHALIRTFHPGPPITEMDALRSEAMQSRLAYDDVRYNPTAQSALLAQVIQYPTPRWPGIRVAQKEWEHVVLTKTNYAIGFVDMRVRVMVPVGLDLHRAGEFTWYEDAHYYSFEVKSSIPSAGELIRQIRLYQAHLPNDRFIVVCPDTRFKRVLAGQGIILLECPL